MTYPDCRVCGESLNGETCNFRVADKAWAHLRCVDETGRDRRDWEAEYDSLRKALLDATGAPDLDEATDVLTDTFATMERVTGATHPEDALSTLTRAHATLARVEEAARVIPIRDVLGEQPTRAIRRWTIDSAPYAIGTPPPTLAEALDAAVLTKAGGETT